MSRLWQQFAALITSGDVRISEHGYDALADDGLTVNELLAGVGTAVVVEEYPEQSLWDETFTRKLRP